MTTLASVIEWKRGREFIHAIQPILDFEKARMLEDIFREHPFITAINKRNKSVKWGAR